MRLFWKTATVAGACVACCAAPLAIVPIVGSLGFATAGLAFASEIGVATALAAAAAGLYLWRRRTIARACQCGPEVGCKTGTSCEVPAPTGIGNGL